MIQARFLKTVGVLSAFAAIIFAGMMNSSKHVRARNNDSGDQREESRIQRGFEIAPVPLNLARIIQVFKDAKSLFVIKNCCSRSFSITREAFA
jgi:hypothetical protein